jgi:hypothetical protein
VDVVVTVPKTFTHPAAPGRKGLAAWLAEGDPPGAPWSGTLWEFTTWGFRPNLRPGERVYVCCEGRLVGYAPLVRLDFTEEYSGQGRVTLVRGGGAVACTVNRPMTGFRGWRYRHWEYAEEMPLELGVPVAGLRGEG